MDMVFELSHFPAAALHRIRAGTPCIKASVPSLGMLDKARPPSPPGNHPEAMDAAPPLGESSRQQEQELQTITNLNRYHIYSYH